MFLTKQVKLCLLSFALFTSGISYGGCFSFFSIRGALLREIERLRAETQRLAVENQRLARQAADNLFGIERAIESEKREMRVRFALQAETKKSADLLAEKEAAQAISLGLRLDILSLKTINAQLEQKNTRLEDQLKSSRS